MSGSNWCNTHQRTKDEDGSCPECIEQWKLEAKGKKIAEAFIAIVIILCIAISVGIAVMQPYFEARAFNKFSETKATYWDAVWTRLRVTSK